MSNFKIKFWLKAFRLHTLPLAAASIGMGGFMAAAHGYFDALIFALALLTTFLLQMLSNLSNDYGDFVSGVDLIDRIGPPRTLQSGELNKNEMLIAILIFTLLSFGSGITLLLISGILQSINAFGFFLALGILAIIASIKYTAGKNPYGYAGLGDLSVLLFFGFTGVLGAYYLQAKVLYADMLLPAASVGMLATAVLNINNLRDIESDKKAGKYTIPVRIGPKKARIYHAMLLIGSIIFISFYVKLHYRSYWQLLYLLSIPGLLINLFNVIKIKEAARLDPCLRQLVFNTLFFVVTFGTGLLLA